MNAKNKELNENVEEYLEVPYIGKMLKKLEELEYINYIPYKGAILTEKGTKIA